MSNFWNTALLPPTNSMRSRQEMLLMFQFITHRQNHLYFLLPISYLSGATKLEHNKSTGNVYMHHQKQWKMRGATLILLFGSAPRIRKSRRMGKKGEEASFRKTSLTGIVFFLNAPNITSSSINVFTAFLTRSLCKPTDYITLPSLMGV